MPAAERDGSRISRETRRLLATVLLSIAALWALARIRFPERAATPNPVTPVLTQITPRLAFEDLERVLFELQPRVLPALALVRLERRALAGDGPDVVVALRVLPDRAIALVDGAALAARAGATLGVRDAATGLTVIGTPAAPAVVALESWRPRRGGDAPRFLVAAEAWRERLELRPVFCAALQPAFSAAWAGEVWAIPPHANVGRGSLLFTTSGALVGLVAGSPGQSVIVPAGLLISAGERLMGAPPRSPGWLGVEVQPLGAALARATGASAGVVVTWVDPRGPAAGRLVATDVVQSAGEAVIGGMADWEARIARTAAGESLALRVVRARGEVDVQLTAAAAPPPPNSPRLGLRMRYRRSLGAEVLGVEEGSVAMRRGIRPGDLLTRVGDVESPSPAQVSRAFADAGDEGVLVAVTRGPGRRLVVALDRR